MTDSVENDLMEKLAILNFDKEEGYINPQKLIAKLPNMPKKVVLCFFSKEIRNMFEKGELELIKNLKSEMGLHPIYKFKDIDIGIAPMGVGAPLAVGLLEEIIALGGETFIACGSCGVLVDNNVGALILPNESIREEGTSFHYKEPSRTIKIDQNHLRILKDYLDSENISYSIGKIWTTDAIYRETKKKVKEYREEGAIAVEMEFSALLAVCQYYQKFFVQILYSGDSLANKEWEGRGFASREDIRLKLIDLSKNFLVDKK